MRVEIRVPPIAIEGDAELTVMARLVEEGQLIREGQPILEADTDKAVVQVESCASGVLQEWRVKAGERVNSEHVVAIVETEPAGEPAESPRT